MITRYFNGPIYQGKGIYLDELFVDQDGNVTTRVKFEESDDTAEVDLQGNTLIPAFRDGHVHPLFAGRESLGVSITGVSSTSEIGRLILEYRKSNPATTWIDGASYDRSITSPRTRQALDEFVADIPVVLHAEDHHTLWVNTKALEAAGLMQGSIPTFDAGGIDVDEMGIPTGILREWDAMNLVLSKEPKRSLADDVRALLRADKHLISAGIIEAQDAWIEHGMTEVYLAAESQLLLNYRLAFREDPNTFDEDWPYFTSLIPRINSTKKLKAQAVKFFIDGVFGSATAAVIDPYESTGKYGDLNWPLEKLVSAINRTHEAGLQTHIHAIGDKAVEFALDALSHANPGSLSPVIAHAELTNNDLIKRAKESSATLCLQPYWAQYNGMLNSCIHHLGSKRVDSLYAIRDMIDVGVKLCFGSDWPVTTFNPIEGIAVAVHRRVNNQQTPHNAHQSIGLAAAIDAYTFRVQEMFDGSADEGLVPGAAFDAVLLSGNLMAKDLDELIATEVLAVYRAGELLPHN